MHQWTLLLLFHVFALAVPSGAALCPSDNVNGYRKKSQLSNGVDVLTDIHTPGGDWLIIQRRESASVDFNRNWTAYQSFFGDLCSNYWLGLDNIHQLCNPEASCELRIDMSHKEEDYYAHYSSFSVASASDKYRLHVDGYSGNAGDAFRADIDGYHHQNGMMFTTSDADNDATMWKNCAHDHLAGWWFSDCGTSLLNGPWIEPGSDGTKKWAAINWSPLTHWEDSLSFVEMKITNGFFQKSNGNWSSWSGWGDCSVTCGEGNRTRQRKCDNPSPGNGGLKCLLSDEETRASVEKSSKSCNEKPCAVGGDGLPSNP